MNEQFKHTVAALVIYDLGRDDRQRLWDTAQSEADVDAADAAEKAALEKVQAAFYEDTKHVNSREHCKLADITHMRNCAMGVHPPAREGSLSRVPIEDRIGGWKR